MNDTLEVEVPFEWPEYPVERGGRGEDGVLRGYTFPRIYTKLLRELTPETSLGYQAIAFARAFGRNLHPWQEWLLIHSLELVEGSFTSDPYPQFRYSTVLILVARQNGKSYWMSTRALWRMFMWEGPADDPTLILGAAHKLDAAEEIMDLALKAIKRSDEFRDELFRAPQGTGQKAIELDNGSRYICEASSDDGGRGKSVDDLLYDEVRQQYSWDSWNALTNTTLARFSSQIIAVSNAGTKKSTVLRSLRKKAIDMVDEGGDVFIAEYSAPEGASIWDEDGWCHANPSLGYSDENGIVYVTEKTMRSKAALVGKDSEDGIPESTFRTENLCQWVVMQAEGPFKPEDIKACTDPDSRIAADSPIFVGVDTSKDRKWTYLAVAGWREDGLPHVEVIVRRAHTEWLPKALTCGLTFKPAGIVFQGRGAPASSLVQYVQEEQEGATGDQPEIVLCQGSDLTSSTAQLHDRVTSHRIRWRPQPALFMALNDTVKKMTGEVFIWDLANSPVDAAPLCAVNLALWGLEHTQVPERQESAYGDSYERWW